MFQLILQCIFVPIILLCVYCFILLRYAFSTLLRCMRYIAPMFMYLMRCLKFAARAMLLLSRCLCYLGDVLLCFVTARLMGLAHAFFNAESHNGRQEPRHPRRMKMNDVNMPSGTRVSITIPARSGCNCTTVGANVKLITLKPDGKMSGREYKIVADEMHKTLQFHNYKSYSIKKIVKVQNCCLWAKFRARERVLAQKQEAGYVNERMLFHGSPSADVIVKTGFDISKANGGLFGKGVYFAQHSSKSNQYAAGYLGHRKMLFCRVALGRMHKLSSTDSSLTQPPARHHSVEGIWNQQFPEYIIYNDAQAYPEYLVHYDIVS